MMYLPKDGEFMLPQGQQVHQTFILGIYTVNP